MADFPPLLQKLIFELSKLPSIGEKSATRLAYYLVNNNRSLGLSLAAVIQKAVEGIRLCERCFHLADTELCSICRNPGRDATLLCVVEKPIDLISIERMGEYRGYYHVLHGLWAPLRGQGPEQMKIRELCQRVEGGGVREVILATSATVEGDATAIYLAKLLADRNIRSSRLAQGIPKGGELEYADDVTLARAFSGRNEMA